MSAEFADTNVILYLLDDGPKADRAEVILGQGPRISVQVLNEALRLATANPEVRFRAAQVHALAGREPQSLESLERAIALGYSRVDAGAADEFTGLRDQPRFRALVGS